jgi:uncharacterized protein (DUF2237 family)
LSDDQADDDELNVFGEPLAPCSLRPMTGYFRDGCCSASQGEVARHLVCAEVTAEFLEFSRSRGNDLTTPNPDYNFPGLVPGDRWCLHIARWVEAQRAGAAPRVALRATSRTALRFTDLATLKAHALDLS